ncbi:Pre-mRNA-processing factor 39 [Hordeum vulgare]|nr:Pre-mRNA-processing factor 39 [Hordeum vulgare]
MKSSVEVAYVTCGQAPRCPLVVHGEDEEAEAAYQEALAAALSESEEEERRKEAETSYQPRLGEATSLSAAGDCVMPSLASPSPSKAESGPTALKSEKYIWDRVVCEWVNAPPI